MPRRTRTSLDPDRPPAPPPPSAIARRRAAARQEGSAAYLERRREIVTAAARVFKEKGLQGANLGDVAAAAGADRASLYYYVESKEELFHEVVREAVEANLAEAVAIRDGGGTAPEKIRSLIRALMRSYDANYPIVYVYIQENLSRVPDEHAGWASTMRRVNKDYERVVIELVERGIEEGTIRPVASPWIVAYGLLGMLGWTNRWYTPDGRASADEIAETFADAVLLGIVVPAHGDEPAGLVEPA
ncbi:MAG: TetR family transcriptional regulator [Actinomycetota bacterium]|nr:TetR family transcriptional regulator [Actinomycetota bacterium]